ncbi:hypothetical protein SpAn4DRAFT_4245 [Sporomusa ovata]|uniref:Uncharacterized protein n=1 Tax=Sporomusa ovata TaxID=2378 RepID=A0A0U1L5C0_9FIRM|nr:hypothetical protein SpAn4DRAFT_1797 [Sporomusa ovata]CQR74888.1 hypothetical protein SpAn4DRAFT_4245 [Sporomusa ovata]
MASREFTAAECYINGGSFGKTGHDETVIFLTWIYLSMF